jgi:hypothetical protein
METRRGFRIRFRERPKSRCGIVVPAAGGRVERFKFPLMHREISGAPLLSAQRRRMAAAPGASAAR